MANYYGAGRTNTFAVKDISVLREALSGTEFSIDDRSTPTQPNLVALFAEDSDGDGGWAQSFWDDDAEDIVDVDVPEMIAEHLAEGQVAIFVHSGHEKLRYLSGYSIAVFSDGRQVRIDLTDIYERAAAEFGVDVNLIAVAAY